MTATHPQGHAALAGAILLPVSEFSRRAAMNAHSQPPIIPFAQFPVKHRVTALYWMICLSYQNSFT